MRGAQSQARLVSEVLWYNPVQHSLPCQSPEGFFCWLKKGLLFVCVREEKAWGFEVCVCVRNLKELQGFATFVACGVEDKGAR